MFLRDLFCYLLVLSILSNYPVDSQDLVVQKVGVDEVTPSSVALQFFVNVNNTGKSEWQVDLVPDLCCVDVGHTMDCGGVINIIGQCSEIIPPETFKHLKLVAPLLDPFNRKGYCNVYADSKEVGGTRVVREIVKIPFDTRLKSIYPKQLPSFIEPCNKIDQDPLNRCQPVDCQRYYNGRKSYFNKLVQRCVELPVCIAEVTTEMPKNIYDPVSNKCVEDTPITREDVAFIKSLMGLGRKPKEILILGNYNSNIEPTKEPVVKDRLRPFIKIKKTEKTGNKTKNNSGNKTVIDPKTNLFHYPVFQNAAFVYVMTNRWAYISLIALVVLQCMLICTMAYTHGRKCCCSKKKLIRKYYNYRQDATITTPLIATSNGETNTTDYQYFSESSNVDKKINKYKACKGMDEAKISVSEDIISKYLNRRDWRRTGPKSEAIYDYAAKVYNEKDKINKSPKQRVQRQKNIVQTQKRDTETMTVASTKGGNVRINFMNENIKDIKKGKPGNLIRNKTERKSSKTNEPKKRSTRPLNETEMLVPEQGITCHNFNYKMKTRTVRSLNDSDMDLVQSEQEINCHSYNWDMDDGSIPSNYEEGKFASQYSDPECAQATKALSSVSIDKSAENSFPNDSIDDYLPERAKLLLTGENVSKYSLSTASNKFSSVSDKTSKNNIVRNMLSVFHKKSKQGPSSYPGAKKSKESLDLKVIHMSPVLNYSSTNENGFMNDARRSRSPR